MLTPGEISCNRVKHLTLGLGSGLLEVGLVWLWPHRQGGYRTAQMRLSDEIYRGQNATLFMVFPCIIPIAGLGTSKN